MFLFFRWGTAVRAGFSALLVSLIPLLLVVLVGCGGDGIASPDRDVRDDFLEDLDLLDGDARLALFQEIIFEIRKQDQDLTRSYLSEFERNLLTRTDDNLTSAEVNKVKGMVASVRPNHLEWALRVVIDRIKKDGP